MRWLALSFPLLLAAASAPVARVEETADAAVSRAEAEAELAASRLAALEKEAARAGDVAARLRAEQAAAAAAIEEAEARISQTSARLELARARAALAEERLAARRAPVSALLAGLLAMGRRPPVLALADEASVDEFVRVKALLDTTMPVIRSRTAALQTELQRRKAFAAKEEEERSQLVDDRKTLAKRQKRFAELEAKASERATELAGLAFGAGDRVIASDEALVLAESAAAQRRAANLAAARIASLEFAPPRPVRGDSALPPTDFGYSLPVEAPLTDGLGSVNSAGIVSRGLRFSTGRGAPVIVPADGTVMFAAPFRGQDGLVIIDHGEGWTSLILGVSSVKPKGSRVSRGELLGRALGPLGVELRRHGEPVSPALIAASSVPLSNRGESR